MKLTAKQSQFIAAIHTFTVEHGYGPTFRDLCQHFGWRSTRTVSCYVEAMERKGAIRRSPGRARALCVVVKEE